MSDKIWNKESIKDLLVANEPALKKALLVVYANQTAVEQSSERTIERNGVGLAGRRSSSRRTGRRIT